MLSRNMLFDNPVADASVDTPVTDILRGERLAEVVAERTNELDT